MSQFHKLNNVQNTEMKNELSRLLPTLMIGSRKEFKRAKKEIEEKLTSMLKETESIFSLQDIEDAIYHERDNGDMMKVVAMFDRGGDASELNNILELVTDAWNYFPHKILNGLSPAERLLNQENGCKMSP